MSASDPDCDALIIGAGFSGIYLLHRLRRAGFRARLIDAAAEPGGIWYWNCYPGARVDSHVPIYELSLPELWQDWTWSERFPGGGELRRYFRYVCDKLELWPDMAMGTRVSGARFDAESDVWRVDTAQGEQISARFLLPCAGFAAKSYTPDIAGLETFAGERHHTAHWPQDGLPFAGKRVAIIGTGASGVQVAQEAVRDAARLTLFQRTPILALPMQQQPLSLEQQAQEKAAYHAIFAKRQASNGGFDADRMEISALDVDAAERTATFERLWQAGGLRFWYNNFSDLLTDKRANRFAYDFWREKVRARIADPSLHEALAPMEPPHPFGTKRPSLEQNYYEIFAQENVALVDLKRDPIVRVVPGGIETVSGLIECDIIVFATGFDAGSGGLIDMNLRGTEGFDLGEAWKDGVRAYLGNSVSGFPNMLFHYGPLSPSGFSNGPTAAELQGDWTTDFLAHLRSAGITRFEPDPAAECEWTDMVEQIGAMTLFPKAKSWYMGDNIPGKKRQLINFPSISTYAQICADVAANGYRGFSLVS